MSPLISKLPFLNIITEVLLIHVPRVKFTAEIITSSISKAVFSFSTVENENTALLILLVIIFYLCSDLNEDSRAFNKETNVIIKWRKVDST